MNNAGAGIGTIELRITVSAGYIFSYADKKLQFEIILTVNDMILDKSSGKW